ncbi:hypothetical protein CURTO8I2_220096 [Curtobacterium sp. 8I-2]|nr:hypothetical protein CURTO8I2_220096 [Curtobacterium sp. 8I-2]
MAHRAERDPADGQAGPVHGRRLHLHGIVERVPDGADLQQRELVPDDPGRHRALRDAVHGAVRADLRRERGRHGADRDPGARVPPLDRVRSDLRRRQGVTGVRHAEIGRELT